MSLFLFPYLFFFSLILTFPQIPRHLLQLNWENTQAYLLMLSNMSLLSLLLKRPGKQCILCWMMPLPWWLLVLKHPTLLPSPILEDQEDNQQALLFGLQEIPPAVNGGHPTARLTQLVVSLMLISRAPL